MRVVRDVLQRRRQTRRVLRADRDGAPRGVHRRVGTEPGPQQLAARRLHPGTRLHQVRRAAPEELRHRRVVGHVGQVEGRRGLDVRPRRVRRVGRGGGQARSQNEQRGEEQGAHGETGSTCHRKERATRSGAPCRRPHRRGCKDPSGGCKNLAAGGLSPRCASRTWGTTGRAPWPLPSVAPRSARAPIGRSGVRAPPWGSRHRSPRTSPRPHRRPRVLGVSSRCSSSVGPASRTMARSSTLRSSRTFPGNG